MGWLIGSIISALMFVVGLFASIGGGDSNSWFPTIIMLVLFFICLKKFSNSRNPELIAKKENEKNEKYEKQKLTPGSKERQLELGADLCIKAKHMAGLPIAEGAEVFLYRCQDKVIFERNQETFELVASNMKDILIKTDTEIQKSHVSSVGGAVGGYVLFGPLGAMVGGRAKEKKSTIVEKYLIFDYKNKDGSQDYISFEVTNEPKAVQFNTNHYDLSKNERTTVSL